MSRDGDTRGGSPPTEGAINACVEVQRCRAMHRLAALLFNRALDMELFGFSKGGELGSERLIKQRVAAMFRFEPKTRPSLHDRPYHYVAPTTLPYMIFLLAGGIRIAHLCIAWLTH